VKTLKVKHLAAMLLSALMLCMGVFAVTAYAATGAPADEDAVEATPIQEGINESMLVNATWLNTEMLRIDVVDLVSGTVSSLAIRLSDFVKDSDNAPFILIQAVDLDGNLSGVIQISNPFYVPQEDNTEDVDEEDYNGLTPDGSGTVVDNVSSENGVEFFTVFTEEGNEFFLVVDRQRNTDNVYLLNAVTEADLMALAERSGNPIENPNISAIPPIEEAVPTPTPTPEPMPEPEEEPARAENNNSNLIIILVVSAIAGGLGYYFKIVKPKKDAVYEDDDFPEDDDEYGYDAAVADSDDDDTDDDSEGGGDER